MPQARAYKVVLTILCLIFPLCDSAAAIEKISPKVAIVVSQSIRPYLEAVEGLRGGLVRDNSPEIDEFDLDSFKGKGRDTLARDLAAGQFDLFIAIGPSAARFIWTRFPSQEIRKLYTMVLGPEKALAPAESACGIALGIPVRTQLQILSCGLPGTRRVGILYDPLWNTEFVKEATQYGSQSNLRVVPLEVSSKKDIPVVLQQHWEGLDALLLIPDHTVISESLVQYIIKQAISEGIAVIGYNRFFYESGAAVAFVLDYEEIGAQTARLALRILAGERCETEAPMFHTWLNIRVIKTLEIQVTKDAFPNLEVGP